MGRSQRPVCCNCQDEPEEVQCTIYSDVIVGYRHSSNPNNDVVSRCRGMKRDRYSYRYYLYSHVALSYIQQRCVAVRSIVIDLNSYHVMIELVLHHSRDATSESHPVIWVSVNQ